MNSFEICKQQHIVLVTDDIKAIKRFDDAIETLFSVHIIYLLYKKEYSHTLYTIKKKS
ncbi:MAG: hypothetical protein U9R21_06610 [Candidatus Thermoplasmatota archaeon]|nr:hypothetical protein [Candidatus Thermoplasmatota archaeon]